MIVTAPSSVRDKLRALPTSVLIDTLARSRPAGELHDPACAVKVALRRLARRYLQLSDEIKEANAEIGPLVTRAAPRLVALPGVGPETAGQLLETAGDNPDRLTSEAAFAHLCAAAPISASSGRTDRHRLNRGGDRHANSALHTIVLVRMKCDPRTQEYVARRTTQGLTKKDIIRCLKRFVAREIHRHLPGVTSTTTPASCGPTRTVRWSRHEKWQCPSGRFGASSSAGPGRERDAPSPTARRSPASAAIPPPHMSQPSHRPGPAVWPARGGDLASDGSFTQRMMIIGGAQ
ncbi:transposase [Streptomyces sp. NPDC053427]|uniref:transposase n=1 Tax=Streptomyces sp. NPDC053427 TaxID=3365701 RepID=UPI0037CE64DD